MGRMFFDVHLSILLILAEMVAILCISIRPIFKDFVPMTFKDLEIVAWPIK